MFDHTFDHLGSAAACRQEKEPPCVELRQDYSRGQIDSETTSECNVCGLKAQCGATRWTSHFLGRAVGKGKAGIAACKGGLTEQSKAMLKEVKELLNDYTHLASAKKAEKEKNQRMFSELQWRESLRVG
jgi:hypothetical protein